MFGNTQGTPVPKPSSLKKDFGITEITTASTFFKMWEQDANKAQHYITTLNRDVMRGVIAKLTYDEGDSKKIGVWHFVSAFSNSGKEKFVMLSELAYEAQNIPLYFRLLDYIQEDKDYVRYVELCISKKESKFLFDGLRKLQSTRHSHVRSDDAINKIYAMLLDEIRAYKYVKGDDWECYPIMLTFVSPAFEGLVQYIVEEENLVEFKKVINKKFWTGFGYTTKELKKAGYVCDTNSPKKNSKQSREA